MWEWCAVHCTDAPAWERRTVRNAGTLPRGNGAHFGTHGRSRSARGTLPRGSCAQFTARTLPRGSGARCGMHGGRSCVGVVHSALHGRSRVGMAHGVECKGALAWDWCTFWDAQTLPECTGDAPTWEWCTVHCTDAPEWEWRTVRNARGALPRGSGAQLSARTFPRGSGARCGVHGRCRLGVAHGAECTDAPAWE